MVVAFYVFVVVLPLTVGILVADGWRKARVNLKEAQKEISALRKREASFTEAYKNTATDYEKLVAKQDEHIKNLEKEQAQTVPSKVYNFRASKESFNEYCHRIKAIMEDTAFGYMIFVIREDLLREMGSVAPSHAEYERLAGIGIAKLSMLRTIDAYMASIASSVSEGGVREGV